jgi:phage shock protein PspC (stress-responsive transcriptional regulator)
MERRRLTRSETDRRIGGVAGGIAEYFDVDPILIRIAFVVSALMGWGLLAYVVLWIALPSRPSAPGGAPFAFRRTPPAVRIAEDRFARGEISAEELERIRQDIMGGV